MREEGEKKCCTFRAKTFNLPSVSFGITLYKVTLIFCEAPDEIQILRVSPVSVFQGEVLISLPFFKEKIEKTHKFPSLYSPFLTITAAIPKSDRKITHVAFSAALLQE